MACVHFQITPEAWGKTMNIYNQEPQCRGETGSTPARVPTDISGFAQVHFPGWEQSNDSQTFHFQALSSHSIQGIRHNKTSFYPGTFPSHGNFIPTAMLAGEL